MITRKSDLEWGSKNNYDDDVFFFDSGQHAKNILFKLFIQVCQTSRTENIQYENSSLPINLTFMFTFSRESESQAARVLFNSLYILARSCSALYLYEIIIENVIELEEIFNLAPEKFVDDFKMSKMIFSMIRIKLTWSSTCWVDQPVQPFQQRHRCASCAS